VTLQGLARVNRVLGTLPVIPTSVRRILLFNALRCVVTSASIASAQIAIDNVHIVPRINTVDVASATYSAPYSGSGLIRTSSNLVLVPVTITDDRNRPVVGLDENNFQLFENKKPQEIKNFSTEDAPVSVGILVDTSGSMAAKLDRAREAVQQFCESSNPDDEFFLITFADQPRFATDFTTHSDELANNLLTANSKGRTSLLDAIYLGIHKMREARYARKALLIISDGGDNHSRYSERDIKSAVRESDVSIYAIGTYERWVSSQEELLGPELLRNIAEATGGFAFSLNAAGDMPAMTRNISSRLRHQYVLAYSPPAATHDGKWHKISVKLRLPKKFAFLHVIARPGYYAGEE
jgi:Ca-activated chloride channel family protein